MSSRTPHLESGLVPSPSLLQKHSLTGVTSFEVYVSDVIGRRFEKVKNGHIHLGIGHRFEDWTSIRDWTSIYIYLIFLIAILAYSLQSNLTLLVLVVSKIKNASLLMSGYCIKEMLLFKWGLLFNGKVIA